MTMKLSFDGDWCATVTDDPLRVTPRFTGDSVDVAQYVDVKERERFVAHSFGSQHWLWDAPDVLRFDPDSRQLAGVEFRLPEESVSAEDAARLSLTPAVRPGGLRAEEIRDFRHEMGKVLCRAPDDSVLSCLRDLDVLDAPLEARIGIAPDVALLVQDGSAVGWSLTDPVRYVTSGFAAPDPNPPSPSTRHLFTECLDLVTTPVVEDLADGEPTALARLRAADEVLRAQPEDRHRADALLEMIATFMEDYGR
ncbi:hypothetical protein ACTWJ9_03085 [Streptomyces sp. GDS52]|uniref:hypothetical protein n=1 Tax=unclassified Streptomyces TaxID=2593676 RepID=UPI00365379F4